MPNTTKSQKVATPDNVASWNGGTIRHCKIESASIVDFNDAGDGAYDLLGVEGTPKEVGAHILEALNTADLSSNQQSLLDRGETLTLNIHVQIRKVSVPNIMPSIDSKNQWFIRYDDGRICPEGGWKSKEAAQAFLDAEVGVPAHVELLV